MGEAAIQTELVGRKFPEWKVVRGIPLSMGNPHYVMFVPEFADNWQRKAAEIQRSSEFKHGVNVEMVVIAGRHDLNVRFFERGVGETQSSGDRFMRGGRRGDGRGQGGIARASSRPGRSADRPQVRNLVFLRGPARLVCRGEFFLS